MQTWMQDIMAALGVSQRQQLAEKLGVNPSTITYVERKGLTKNVFGAMQTAANAEGVALPKSVLDAWLSQARAGNGKDTAA